MSRNICQQVESEIDNWCQCFCFVKTCAPRKGPTLPSWGGATCTTGAFCVGSRKGWEDVKFSCVEIHLPSAFTFNFHLRSFIFIWQSPHPPPTPLSFETPFRLSVALLPISVPFSSLYAFHLSTPMARPHSISSLTPHNLVPAFPLPQPSVSWQHEKKCNSVLLSQSRSAFSSDITQLWGSFSHNLLNL